MFPTENTTDPLKSEFDIIAFEFGASYTRFMANSLN
jgi:hypothetical protein